MMLQSTSSWQAVRHNAIDPLSSTALIITASFDDKQSFHSLPHCAVWCTKVDEECELIIAEFISRPISLASLLAMLVNDEIHMLSDQYEHISLRIFHISCTSRCEYEWENQRTYE